MGGASDAGNLSLEPEAEALGRTARARRAGLVSAAAAANGGGESARGGPGPQSGGRKHGPPKASNSFIGSPLRAPVVSGV